MNLKNGPVSSGKMYLLVIGLICLIGFIAYKDYFLFHKFFYFRGFCMDTISFNYPFIVNQADYISKYGIPSWSFKFGMGQNIFPFFLYDPFNLLIYFPPGSKHILSLWIYKDFPKIVLGGLVFYKYLKTIKLSDYSALLGSLFFSFSSFIIMGSIWSCFLFDALTFALLLLSFELFFLENKWLWFPLVIFIICVSQPFNLYIFGLFLATYMIFRLVHTGTFSMKNLALLYGKAIGLGVVGILLSGPFLLENAANMLQSPRVTGPNSFATSLLSRPFYSIIDNLQFKTASLRLFSNYLTGLPDNYKGWFCILEAPTFYCGLPCLLLMPQVFRI